MRVSPGRAADGDADHQRTLAMADRVVETGEPALRVWRPHPLVAFGRRDRRSEGYSRAKAVARDHDFAVTERAVGGRAVAFTGPDVAFALAEPVENHRAGIRKRYERVLDAVQRALSECGVDAERGEPPNSFCPGSHSLQVDGGKVVGVAQRVRQDVAVVAGVVVVDARSFSTVLEPVYDLLDVPFDPTSVGALSAHVATPPGDTVGRAVESVIVDAWDADATLVRET